MADREVEAFTSRLSTESEISSVQDDLMALVMENTPTFLSRFPDQGRELTGRDRTVDLLPKPK